ncbi:MAG: hypothetical protein KKA54_05745 [Proteobacteria bacterium]|nr:hypothetical protein [Pseudomonadota bacterium]MBU0965870.1 hypothetical protein [Pseudomonadota bacterium]
MEQIFKQCPACRTTWFDYTDFLADPCLQLIGYQALFENLTKGLFLFNHSCGTTMSITVEALQHLYSGPVYTERVIGSKKCPGLCLVKKETGPCPAECDCAYVRSIMQIVKQWQKGEICVREDAGRNLPLQR